MGHAAGIRPHVLAVAVVALLLGALPACGEGQAPAATRPAASPGSPIPGPSTPVTTRTPGSPRPSGRPVVGAVPPPWLGTRPLPHAASGYGEIRPTPPELVMRRFTLPDRLPALPGAGFASRVETPVPASVIARSTWKPGCPVAASQLSWVRLAFWGFDGRRHTGELLVNRTVADQMVSVFGRLYAARFPIEEMRVTRLDELGAPPTGDGNNTGAFNCRRMAPGASTYSEHAYGLAVDVNPFQNPYSKDKLVLPELASAYLDRGWVRPGMITADGPVVGAFAAVGWTWGGTWHALKDRMHFSQNGR